MSDATQVLTHFIIQFLVSHWIVHNYISSYKHLQVRVI